MFLVTLSNLFWRVVTSTVDRVLYITRVIYVEAGQDRGLSGHARRSVLVTPFDHNAREHLACFHFHFPRPSVC